MLKMDCYFIKEVGWMLRQVTSEKDRVELLQSLNFLLEDAIERFRAPRKNFSESFNNNTEEIRTMVRLVNQAIPILLTQEEKKGSKAKIREINKATKKARAFLVMIKTRIALTKKAYPRQWTIYYDAEFGNFK